MAWLTGDRRLTGRWRSDAQLTLAEWPFPAEATAEQREAVCRMFGKLELSYSRWRYRATFEGQDLAGWYRVLAKDRSSVIIESWQSGPAVGPRRNLFHIHFSGDHYWITLGESNTREFFRRIG